MPYHSRKLRVVEPEDIATGEGSSVELATVAVLTCKGVLQEVAVDGVEDNGRMWWGIPPESRILDSWAWISSSLSKKELIDIGRKFVLPMPFNPVANSIPSAIEVRSDFVVSCTVISKAPCTPALFALNFPISSVSQVRGSSGKSAESASFSSHESGSLNIFSAMALPGIPPIEVRGVGDTKGESETSRSG